MSVHQFLLHQLRLKRLKFGACFEQGVEWPHQSDDLIVENDASRIGSRADQSGFDIAWLQGSQLREIGNRRLFDDATWTKAQ